MAFEKMTHRIETDAPGTATELTLFRIGPQSAATKIYLQAALHADEQPGIMAIHHLLPMLKAADERGELTARFTIFPMVNPLGMSQRVFEGHPGRYDFRTGTNFNRRWPDLFAAASDTLADRLTNDAVANVKIIRDAVKDAKSLPCGKRC